MNYQSVKDKIKQNISVDNVRIAMPAETKWTQGAEYENVPLSKYFDDIKSYKQQKRTSSMLSQSHRSSIPNPFTNPSVKLVVQEPVTQVTQPTQVTQHIQPIHSTHVTQPIHPTLVTQAPFENAFLKSNSFYKKVLSIIDPTVDIFPENTMVETLEKFKNDLANNLSNEKQLYKKLGYSRKRSSSIDKMKDALKHKDGDKELYNDIYDYISKLLKKQMTIIKVMEASKIPERQDFNADVDADSDADNSSTEVVVIQFQNDVINNIELMTITQLNTLAKEMTLSHMPLSRHSMASLKEIATLLGCVKKCANKDGLLKIINEKIEHI